MLEEPASRPGRLSRWAKNIFSQTDFLPKIDLILILQGAQDAYVHVTLIKKWDICAPAAILAAINKDGLQVHLIIKKNSLTKIFNFPFAITGPVIHSNWRRDRLQQSRGGEGGNFLNALLCRVEIFFGNKSLMTNANFQNGMGVLATLRHHNDFVDALKDEPFVEELKKSLDKRIRS